MDTCDTHQAAAYGRYTNRKLEIHANQSLGSSFAAAWRDAVASRAPGGLVPTYAFAATALAGLRPARATARLMVTAMRQLVHILRTGLQRLDDVLQRWADARHQRRVSETLSQLDVAILRDIGAPEDMIGRAMQRHESHAVLRELGQSHYRLM